MSCNPGSRAGKSNSSFSKFLMDGRQEDDLSRINVKTLWNFMDFNGKKF